MFSVQMCTMIMDGENKFDRDELDFFLKVEREDRVRESERVKKEI